MANLYYDSPEKVAAWRASSATRIGASEAGGACGIDPFKNPLSIYCAKVFPEDVPPVDSDEAKWGLLDEPAISRAYELETGRTLVEPPACVHPVHTFMGATPDRMVKVPGGDPRLVQLKSPGDFSPGWGPSGSELIPDYIRLQVEQEMEVCSAALGIDFRYCDVAARIGKTDFRIYPIPRTREFIEPVIEIEAALWERIQRRDPPPPDFGHGATPELMRRLNKPRSGTAIDLPDECLEWARSLADVRAAKKLNEADEEQLKAQLNHAMGTAAVGRISGFTVLRSVRHCAGHYRKASESVVIKVKLPNTPGPEEL